MLKSIRLLICFLCCAFVTNFSLAHDEFIEVIAESKASVVVLDITRSKKKIKYKKALDALGSNAEFFEKDLKKQQNQPRKSRGSGFVVDHDSLPITKFIPILTAAHVVDGASKIKVLFSNGRRATADIVWLSKRMDLALLSVNVVDLDVVGLQLGQEPLREGQAVLSIAASFDLRVSSSLGIVSALNVELANKKKLPLIQTDAAINPGSSGGPLLNSQGQVVGIISNIYTQTGTFSGTAFAVPASIALTTINKQ